MPPVPPRSGEPPSLLVAGTLPPPICGTTVSLESLIQQLRALSSPPRIMVVDTGGIRGSRLWAPWRFVRMAYRFCAAALRSDAITLHLCPRAIPWLGVPALLLGRVLRKPVVLRLFGGQDFRDFPGWSGHLQRWVARHCDHYLAQTHRLVASAEKAGIHGVSWYPTSRPDPCEPPKRPAGRCQRLIYIGWVKASKGVPLLLRADPLLPPGVTVDVYGPFDGMSEADFEGLSSVNYRGVIPPGDALEVLRDYDALVLPTHWEGEGYPGVILEAYLAGLPVITTRFRDIPEIVDESSGILVPPQALEPLVAAICRLASDPDSYQRLAQGATVKGATFMGSMWAQRLVDICDQLVRAR